MKIGRAAAFRALAIFVVVVAAMLALKDRGMPDFTGVLWLILLLATSLYFVWSSWRAGGWAALKQPKIFSWMSGEDDANRR